MNKARGWGKETDALLFVTSVVFSRAPGPFHWASPKPAACSRSTASTTPGDTPNGHLGQVSSPHTDPDHTGDTPGCAPKETHDTNPEAHTRHKEQGRPHHSPVVPSSLHLSLEIATLNSSDELTAFLSKRFPASDARSPGEAHAGPPVSLSTRPITEAAAVPLR